MSAFRSYTDDELYDAMTLAGYFVMTLLPRPPINRPSEYGLHDELESEILRRGGRFARRAVERHRAEIPPDPADPWAGVTMAMATMLHDGGMTTFALEAVRRIGAARGLAADDRAVHVNRAYRDDLVAFVRGDPVPGVPVTGGLTGTGSDGTTVRVPFGPDAVAAAVAFFDRPGGASHLRVHDEQSILMAHAHGLRVRRA